MNLQEIQDAFNELRLLVLVECEDGKFRQVMLSPERFKKVSEASVAHPHEEQPDDLREGYEIACQHLNTKWSLPADAFLGLASIYEDADVCDNLDELEDAN